MQLEETFDNIRTIKNHFIKHNKQQSNKMNFEYSSIDEYTNAALELAKSSDFDYAGISSEGKVCKAKQLTDKSFAIVIYNNNYDIEIGNIITYFKAPHYNKMLKKFINSEAFSPLDGYEDRFPKELEDHTAIENGVTQELVESYSTNRLQLLLEDNRNKLQLQNKAGKNYKTDQSKGKNRYQRRLHSKMSTSTRNYNLIDVNKLFFKDILDVSVPVKGETNDYLVRISFGGLIKEIQKQVKLAAGKLDLRLIMRALVTCFNNSDVYIGCSCPDFKFRFGWWTLAADISSISAQDWRLSGNSLVVDKGPDITNPDDDLGAGCKHTCLVLSNTKWLTKTASTINNYINYLKDKQPDTYKEKLYPKIYCKEFDEDNPLDTTPSTKKFTDDQKPEDDLALTVNPEELTEPVPGEPDDALDTDSETINKANEYGATRTQFKPGNNKGKLLVNVPKFDTKQTISDSDTIADVR